MKLHPTSSPAAERAIGAPRPLFSPRFPGVTMILCGTTATLWMLPLASFLLDYNRPSIIASHQYARLLTCHLTHWSLNHLLWDVGALALLGSWCEWQMPRRFLLTLLTSAVAIPAAIFWLLPDMEFYRGLSGIDSALFGLLVTTLVATTIRRRRWLTAAALVAIAVLFVAKLAFEIIYGTSFFVNASPSQNALGFIPVPLAHAVGALCGCIAGASPACTCGVEARNHHLLTSDF
ncbi:MAG TPA: rhombosortase [Tepidisphaeraceae bacterium]|jgi:rhomboid family GlyGly-CTERM serine protease